MQVRTGTIRWRSKGKGGEEGGGRGRGVLPAGKNTVIGRWRGKGKGVGWGRGRRGAMGLRPAGRDCYKQVVVLVLRRSEVGWRGGPGRGKGTACRKCEEQVRVGKGLCGNWAGVRLLVNVS